MTKSPPADAVCTGRDQTLRLDNETTTLALQGAGADDQLEPSAVFVTWTVKQAPKEAIVTFDDPDRLTATATFNQIGKYVPELKASDGSLTATDTMNVRVNQSPIVEVGDDRAVNFLEPAPL
ncbi:hypothetical protein K9N68_34805 (plasmid) [Kovacikia minuta CCNUW1]|uniref:hypothetical protein n=1 Tax=Kovacikia minuta TaxID=2931930 RepID=UPI001CCE259E|nr:hypothetical protein [Kovacikia minuta]UBF30375.1 hypothetical protein K9N68_34805 [Kovacikia minuta CCNUW1]